MNACIQNNKETYKAFKKIEPLISLTKQNGNNGNVSKFREVINHLESENAILKSRIDYLQAAVEANTNNFEKLKKMLEGNIQKFLTNSTVIRETDDAFMKFKFGKSTGDIQEFKALGITPVLVENVETIPKKQKRASALLNSKN